MKAGRLFCVNIYLVAQSKNIPDWSVANEAVFCGKLEEWMGMLQIQKSGFVKTIFIELYDIQIFKINLVKHFLNLI